MRSGKLDRTLRIDRFSSDSADEYGVPVNGFTPLATLRAQIIQANTEEAIRNGAEDTTLVIFRTRWLAGVTTADRVVYEGRFFNIKETREIGRREGLEIRAVEKV
ncbi:phage head closure protein [Rhizobium sp. BE258]|uniref:phage head closure protein n=1 Tax=Rhizobium sp. BE258 TaxID=2817722 RepID=UPI00285FB373|nr:phage head closure protein [Rhizobium sp. BE258]MDR7147052.1 SPP1 family predicted phage head-tail adaptor [Rhizobium sp. BE258]